MSFRDRLIQQRVYLFVRKLADNGFASRRLRHSGAY
jgi:hypothetical protein